MIIREDYLSKIRPFIGKDIIKVLTGIRRSGKSVLLEQLCHEIHSPNTVFLNFEDLGNWHLCECHALHDYVCAKIGDSTEQFYLFFDEIQEVQGWEKAVNSLRVKFHADIYITGSNSRLLSGELATCIAGRYVSFVVYPFSFSEFKMAAPDDAFIRRAHSAGLMRESPQSGWRTGYVPPEGQDTPRRQFPGRQRLTQAWPLLSSLFYHIGHRCDRRIKSILYAKFFSGHSSMLHPLNQLLCYTMRISMRLSFSGRMSSCWKALSEALL